MAVSKSDIFSRPAQAWPLMSGVYMGYGWYDERECPWSCQSRSSLVFDLSKVAAGSALRLALYVFNVSPDAPRTLLVQSAGNPDQRLVLTGPDFMPFTLLVPRDPERPEVVFVLDRLESPVDVGLSSDNRLLGLTLKVVSKPMSEQADFARSEMELAAMGQGAKLMPRLKKVGYHPRRILSGLMRRMKQ